MFDHFDVDQDPLSGQDFWTRSPPSSPTPDKHRIIEASAGGSVPGKKSTPLSGDAAAAAPPQKVYGLRYTPHTHTHTSASKKQSFDLGAYISIILIPADPL